MQHSVRIILLMWKFLWCLFSENGPHPAVTGDPDFSSAPKLVAIASADFQRCDNFLRGCLWFVCIAYVSLVFTCLSL